MHYATIIQFKKIQSNVRKKSEGILWVQKKILVTEVRFFNNYRNSDRVTTIIVTIPTVAIPVVTEGDR